MDLAGYKATEFDTSIGIVPDATMTFGIVRALSEADKDYLERMLRLDAHGRTGAGPDLQRKIVRSVLDVSESEGYDVNQVDVELLPLPSLKLVLKPTGAAAGPPAPPPAADAADTLVSGSSQSGSAPRYDPIGYDPIGHNPIMLRPSPRTPSPPAPTRLTASWRLRLAAWVVVAGCVLAALVHAWPPHVMTMETGPVGGSYYLDTLAYQKILAARGIELRIRQTPNSMEIAGDVRQSKSGVDVGFVHPGCQRSDGCVAAQPGPDRTAAAVHFHQRRTRPANGVG